MGVRFNDSNSMDNVLEYVTIEYAGPTYGASADLYLDGTSRVSVSHCTLSDSSGFGFEFNDNPTITFDANTVTRNATGAGHVQPWHMGVLTTTSTYTGNTADVLLVRCGEHHRRPDLVQPGRGLHAGERPEGQQAHDAWRPASSLVFPAANTGWVTSTGSLTANGTSGNPIVLTGSTQSPGFWIGVRFQDSNSINNVLEYVTIKYAGPPTARRGPVHQGHLARLRQPLHPQRQLRLWLRVPRQPDDHLRRQHRHPQRDRRRPGRAVAGGRADDHLDLHRQHRQCRPRPRRQHHRGPDLVEPGRGLHSGRQPDGQQAHHLGRGHQPIFPAGNTCG